MKYPAGTKVRITGTRDEEGYSISAHFFQKGNVVESASLFGTEEGTTEILLDSGKVISVKDDHIEKVLE